MIEVRFHGRGGQGAVTAAELLAVAVGEGGKRSQAFPFFGVERRGAPVMSFCRIDEKPIRLHQQVYEPDYVVVLDNTLIEGGTVDVCSGLKKNGVVIINSNCSKEAFKLPTKNIYTVDATSIALKHFGRALVNTAMLGAFAKVYGLKLEAVKRAISEHFPKELAEKNMRAVEECFNQTK
ncbi:MAG: pyruvate ferredoxin oxidoreductase subunit gamma [Candidatus Micrarchaeota archaeon]